MTSFRPAYSMTVKAPRSVDITEQTTLVPIGGAPHSDPFVVNSTIVLGGSKPYLDYPKGKKDTLDVLTKKVTIGGLTVRLLDAKIGSGNAQRWFTAFIGDATGKLRLKGCKAILEESLDNGVTWKAIFTGRIGDIGLDTKQYVSIELRSMADDMQKLVFTGAPLATVTYASVPALFPVGLPKGWASGTLPSSLPENSSGMKGSITAWSRGASGAKSITLDSSVDGTQYTAITAPAFAAAVGLASAVVIVKLTSGPASGTTYAFRLPKRADGSVLPGKNFRNKNNLLRFYVTEFGPLANLDIADPFFHDIADNTNVPTGTTCQFYVVPDNVNVRPTTGAPLFIDDVHPVQMWADIEDGKFSVLTDAATPRPIAGRASPVTAPLYSNSSIGVGSPWDVSTFTVTANAAVGPDGLTTASRIQAPVGSGYVRAAITGLQPNTLYTVSWWIKNNGGAGSPFAKINGYPLDSPSLILRQYAPTAAWSQVSYTFLTGSGISGSNSLYVYVTADQSGSAVDCFVSNLTVTVPTTASDAFNRTDSATTLGKADTGQIWTVPSGGTFGVQTNKGYVAVGAGNTIAFIPAWADATMTSNITISPTAGRANVGLIFRYKDASNYLLLSLSTVSGVNPVRLYKNMSPAGFASLAELPATSPPTPSLASFGLSMTAGQTYAVAVTMKGATLTVSLNGIAVLSYTLSQAEQAVFLTPANVGLYLNNDSGNDDGGSRWDDFTVTTAEPWAALIADKSFDTERWVITESTKANDWVEKEICQPCNLTYYLDGQGRVVPVDMRLTNNAVVSGTITDSDLVSLDFVPKWQVQSAKAVYAVNLTYYVDYPVPPSDLSAADQAFADVPLSNVQSVQDNFLVVNPGSSPRDAGDQIVDYGTSGLRLTPKEFAPSDALTGQSVAKLTSIDRIAKFAGRMTDLLPAFAGGATVLPLSLRRGSAADTSCVQGTFWTVTLSMLPDPGTNQRGGTRLMLCTSRTENGKQVDFEFLDWGANVQAAVPTIGTLALSNGGLLVPVTINALGDPARVEYAVTAAGTTQRPTPNDPAWTLLLQASRLLLLTGNGTMFLPTVPSGVRIWVRGRSQPVGAGLRQPSVWAYPTTGFIDVAALSAPTGLSASNLTGNTVDLAWTNVDTVHDIEVYLTTGSVPSVWTDAMKLFALPAGSNRISLGSLTASQAYAAAVRCVDQSGGASAFATTTFTTTSTNGKAPTPPQLDIATADLLWTPYRTHTNI